MNTITGPLLLTLALALGADAEPKKLPSRPAELFQTTRVWNLHLTFTPEEWANLEPKGGGGFGFFGGRGGGGGPRGQGGPGGPPNFSPATFVAPAFLRAGDRDQDGKLSREEFRGLGERWFGEWDREKTGKLTGEQLRAGLNAGLAGPGGPPGGGGPGGPGGGGPGGGRGPGGGGFNLQGPEGKRNGLASAMGLEFNYVHADLEFEGQVFKDVAVRYKGNGTFVQSRGSPKRSLKIDLNKFVAGRKLAGVAKLNLHNCITDASWMNEVLAFRLHRDAGVPAPRTAYARVFITVPGKEERKYLGLYSLVENVDQNFVEANFGTRAGGLLKPVTPSLFADLGANWSSYRQTYDPKTKLSENEILRVMSLCRLVSGDDDAEFAARLGDHLDLEAVARFMAVMVWLSDLDGILGPGQNFYVYLRPGTQKMVFMPWDQDHSWGQFGMRGSQEDREQLSIHRPWQGENRFLERIFAVEAFKKLYLAKLEEFTRTIFAPERFPAQVDEIAQAIRPAVVEESDGKLERFEAAVFGEGATDEFFGGFGFRQPNKPIKPFVKIRAQSVADQLAGKSEGRKLGEFGFGGGRGGGGRGGGGRPGRGGFGPGNFLADPFTAALDANKDGTLAREEFVEGFSRWFESWNADKGGSLTEEQLRAGIDKDLAPRGGPPGGPRFGNPPGGGAPGGGPPGGQ